MKRVRRGFNYANVMSSIAIFLILGGATALAAKKIGSNQLKPNSVTTAKIKKNAVTTAKIRNGAVTGDKIKLDSLGTVPTAASAETVNGITTTKFGERSAGSTAEKSVFNNGQVQVTFACDGAGKITVNVYTLSDHASIQSYGNGAPNIQDSDFNIAENPLTLSKEDEQRDVVFTDEGGHVVHLSYLAEQMRSNGPKCILAGFAIAQ